MAPAKKASKAPPTGKKTDSPKRQTSKSQPDPQTSKRSTRATRRATNPPFPGGSDINSRGRKSVPLSPPRAPTKGPRPTAKRTRIRNEDEADSPSRLQDITEAVERAANADVVDRAPELREMKQARLLKEAIRDNQRLRGECRLAILRTTYSRSCL